MDRSLLRSRFRYGVNHKLVSSLVFDGPTEALSQREICCERNMLGGQKNLVSTN